MSILCLSEWRNRNKPRGECRAQLKHWPEWGFNNCLSLSETPRQVTTWLFGWRQTRIRSCTNNLGPTSTHKCQKVREMITGLESPGATPFCPPHPAVTPSFRDRLLWRWATCYTLQQFPNSLTPHFPHQRVWTWPSSVIMIFFYHGETVNKEVVTINTIEGTFIQYIHGLHREYYVQYITHYSSYIEKKA